jgi:type I thyroxine 5'-deiodinase
MMALYEWCRDRVACVVVYIAEAHTTDGWQMPANEQEGFCLRQPATFEERCAGARLMHTTLGLTIPTLVDGMDDAASEAFAAWPERIYVAGADGRIAYKSAPGPWGFRVREAAVALQRLLTPGRPRPAPLVQMEAAPDARQLGRRPG